MKREVVDLAGDDDMPVRPPVVAPFGDSNLPRNLSTNGRPTCCLCGLAQSDVQQLEMHLCADHLDWVPFKCNYCFAFFPTEFALRQHLNAAHAGQPLVLTYKADDDKKAHLQRLMEKSMQSLRTNNDISWRQQQNPPWLAASPQLHQADNHYLNAWSGASPSQSQQPQQQAGSDSYLNYWQAPPPPQPFLFNSPRPAAPSARFRIPKSEPSSGNYPAQPARVADVGGQNACLPPVKRPQNCRLCSRTGSGAPGRHVWQQHMSKPASSCLYCEYGCAVPSEMRAHVRAKHADRRQDFADNRPLHMDEFRVQYAKCWAAEPPREKTAAEENVASNVATEKMVRPTSEAKDAAARDTQFCNLCEKTLLRGNISRHVWLHHVKTPALSCHYCPMTHQLRSSMKEHVKKKHPNEPQRFIDKLGELAGEHRDAYNRCLHRAAEPEETAAEADEADSQAEDVPPAEESQADAGAEAADDTASEVASMLGEREAPSRNSDSASSLSNKRGVAAEDEAPPSRNSDAASRASKRARSPSLTANEDSLRSTSATASKQTPRRCRLCDCQVSNNSASRKYHILRDHVDELAMQCPYCPYPLKNTVTTEMAVLTHVRRKHPKEEARVIDRREQLKPMIEQVRLLCFPEGGGNDSATKLPDLAQGEGGELDCRVCRQSVELSPVEHIFRVHIQRTRYECQWCDFTELWSLEVIRNHMSSAHQDGGHNAQIQPDHYFDLTDRYEVEMAKQMPRCFGAAWQGFDAAPAPPSRTSPACTSTASGEPPAKKTAADGTVCTVCFQTVAQQQMTSHVYMHLSSDQGKPRYSCKGCDRTGTVLGPMVIHVRSKHPLPAAMGTATAYVIDKEDELKTDYTVQYYACFPLSE